MIAIRREGDAIVPELCCEVCQCPLPLPRAWVAFPALGANQVHSRGVWAHRACIDGECRTRLGCERVVLWRGSDLLARLLRQC
jgi:hypothetical protein